MNSTVTRHRCMHCTKDYAGLNGLRQHIDKIHWKEQGQDPKYVCEFCDRPHACSSNLKRHLLSCKNNPCRITVKDGEFKCDECSRTFKQKGNLKQHMARIHPNVPQAPSDNRWRRALPTEERKKLDLAKRIKKQELNKKINEILLSQWNALDQCERDEWDTKSLD